MKLAPLPADALRALHVGGTQALAALDRRIASASGDIAMELNQIAEPSTIAAIERSVAEGNTRVHLLADARVPGGGYEDRLRAASEGAGGRYVTYGPTDESWQHAKTFHFTDAHGDPETWVGNLAPIPKAHERTELSLVLGGDAAKAARAVTDATLEATDSSAIADAIDAAGRLGVLFNDPLVGRSNVTNAIAEATDAANGADLLVITKGIQHPPSTTAIIDAHNAGRQVQVYVRDIARADAERLAEAGVDAWQVSGGLQPRVNVFFAGDRGVATTSFMWENMVGDASVATSRDSGVLLDGAQGRLVRAAALETVHDMPTHTSIEELVRRGDLPDTI
ncbi:MAG: hypothetical protein JWL76_225 [Thermoleophilia bacterium]|nr:hypothetical protein [Thermoleophilia bacterium]